MLINTRNSRLLFIRYKLEFATSEITTWFFAGDLYPENCILSDRHTPDNDYFRPKLTSEHLFQDTDAKKPLHHLQQRFTQLLATALHDQFKRHPESKIYLN